MNSSVFVHTCVCFAISCVLLRDKRAGRLFVEISSRGAELQLLSICLSVYHKVKLCPRTDFTLPFNISLLTLKHMKESVPEDFLLLRWEKRGVIIFYKHQHNGLSWFSSRDWVSWRTDAHFSRCEATLGVWCVPGWKAMLREGCWFMG